jgi:hypothetical protein
VDIWLNLVCDFILEASPTGFSYKNDKLSSSTSLQVPPPSTTTDTNPSTVPSLPAIAVHCVSGLGRAPILVAIAILEFCPNLEILDVIEYLRRYRRGVLNVHQMRWLEDEFGRKMRRRKWKELVKRLQPSGSQTNLSGKSVPFWKRWKIK